MGIGPKTHERKRDLEASLIRAARDKEDTAAKAIRTERILAVTGLLISMAGVPLWFYGPQLASWVLVGFTASLIGATFAYETGWRTKLGWVLIPGGAIVSVAALLALSLNR